MCAHEHRQAITAALAGEVRYDDPPHTAQGAVRAEWTRRMDSRREVLDLAEEFGREGRSYVGLDDRGDVVHFGT